ncbi:MAG: hypothetical protein IOC80_06505 [Rhodobacter sp.]|nr:hypothetical protein [Rhodobacter sp.]MCA3515078.1 hypothetical protein [Rhodobacter sp.]MCA3521562.1 hypothetical protein [Rhodobacter sp.]MCA3521890.1 hypothetical protein [Rhodobacter sp.]MCA3524811.1 hypothetical protein [Rhodobacter sp.]
MGVEVSRAWGWNGRLSGAACMEWRVTGAFWLPEPSGMMMSSDHSAGAAACMTQVRNPLPSISPSIPRGCHTVLAHHGAGRQ